MAWLYVVGGAIGFVSAFALAVEKIEKLSNPDYVPSCSLNPIVSCGSVMDSSQAALFGFPNPLIGVAAFPVVITAGVAALAGFRPPRWFWLGMQAGTTLALVFIHWLIAQSLYEIGALCPYCMVVWAVTIPLFWYTTLHNLREGHFGGGRALGVALSRFHSVVVVVWYLVIVTLILLRFWDFWTS
ncbi:vitamin K epoxide reductase family protein [Saccharopolyspora sp. TS4A08]|uniref:Vitamin K epoxide reductase family protein n=1 Tax=Saccharopolyspora ipomoeae TaxID=3042027 RepID=A0ABT6PYN1_9PSEU|nr:vitamin K epoxide reductase family protein [Saccharopolyspora sp. TS4A08]MDI2032768.1 vitamin K epoxide reductase family protein [Saccharopolyspora sp. TS4A08]